MAFGRLRGRRRQFGFGLIWSGQRLMQRSDADLIQACQDGNQAAWDELIQRYGRLIYSIPRRYGLSEADADDVFASVWATVFRKLGELRDQTRLSAWLITTTHRESWRVGRRGGAAKYAHLEEHFTDLAAPSAEKTETWERQHLVRLGLEKLGGRCQELLAALFVETVEPSYEAIAQRLGMPVGSIGPTRARCFKKLQAILEELGLDADAVAAGNRGG
jgi:RNA polymerase sigma factor (sigma-70 family)